MKYIIIAIAMIIVNNAYSQNVFQIDSISLNKRIENTLERISNDSLFKSYLENDFGKLVSFKVNDTLQRLILRSYDLINIYHCYSNKFIKSKITDFKKFNKPYKNAIIVSLDSNKMNMKSNYLVDMDIHNRDLFEFLIQPTKYDKGWKSIYCFVLFNKNDKIKKFIIKSLVVSKGNIKYDK
jgi:hypothetical protein